MIAASIDIGTNTVLLLVAELQSDNIRPIKEIQRIPRLGRGVDNSGNLDPESMNRVVENLLEYKGILKKEYPDTVSNTIVTATSAVRDASNREEFIDLVKKKTGWKIQLLSGSEEAETTYEGALSVLEDRSDQGNLILDIGGGSSELAYGWGYNLQDAISLNMGSVRFTERFFTSNPPEPNQIEAVVNEIRRLIRTWDVPKGAYDLIGVAGTVTSIAAIDLNMEDYDTEKLNGFYLKKSSVQYFIDEFSTIPWQEIEQKYPMFLKGRGEVVLAGILILREVMNECECESILISTGGIRHGSLVKSLEKK